MSDIIWVFVVVAIVAVIVVAAARYFLRDKAPGMKISDEKMRRVQARKARIEAEESAEDKEW